jgi:hypothetical protein
MATVLSPAESLVLLKPNGTPAREAVKVTLLSLLAQGLLRIEEETEQRFLWSRKVACVRPTGRTRGSLAPHAASLMQVVQDAQRHRGVMKHLVDRAREAYGTRLETFNSLFIIPALIGRGLLEEGRTLLFFRKWNLTAAGAAEQKRIEHDIERARTIPALLHSNPAEAAAIALAVGGTLLLIEELRPYFRQLSEAMRTQSSGPDGYDGGGSSSDGSGSDDSHRHPDDRQNHDAGSPADNMSLHDAGTGNLDLGSLELGAFDADAFATLDAGMATFDSSFDASTGGDGGGGGGDGGGNGGGGD